MNSLIQLTLKSWKRLSGAGKKSTLFFTISMVLTSGLDAFAIYLLASVLNSGTNSTNNFIFDNISTTILFIVILFVARSASAVAISWLSLRAFAKEELLIGKENYQSLQKMKWEQKQNYQLSDYFSILDRGPNNLIQGVILSVTSLISEIFSTVAILCIVAFMQPLTAAIAVTYFLTVAMIQHKLLSLSVKNAGEAVNRNIHLTQTVITDSFFLSKLLSVMPSRSLSESLQLARNELAISRAKLVFLTTLPRYFMESILALGFGIIGGLTLLVDGAESVIPAIVLFSAAGFRLLPSINKIQNLILSLFGYSAQAEEAFKLESKFAATSQVSKNHQVWVSENSQLSSRTILKLENVSYTYPNSNANVLKNLNFEFELGLQYAVVGPSGAGKTTFVDIILGLLTPTTGRLIWNEKLKLNSVAYVPQDSYLAHVDLASNVALEWTSDVVNLEKIKRSLNLANLNPEEDLNLPTNDLHLKSLKLSGGQRQRVGIARALYRESNLVIFDEATSALDADTEHKIIQTIEGLKGLTTTITVAHRLTTIKNVDCILYFDKGELRASGTFTDLRSKLPKFEQQVSYFLLED